MTNQAFKQAAKKVQPQVSLKKAPLRFKYSYYGFLQTISQEGVLQQLLFNFLVRWLSDIIHNELSMIVSSFKD